jgi:hypothetical protein
MQIYEIFLDLSIEMRKKLFAKRIITTTNKLSVSLSILWFGMLFDMNTHYCNNT